MQVRASLILALIAIVAFSLPSVTQGQTLLKSFKLDNEDLQILKTQFDEFTKHIIQQCIEKLAKVKDNFSEVKDYINVQNNLETDLDIQNQTYERAANLSVTLNI